ncbi:hypothetical protein D9613_012062 [Agrocybe pediades]|uniref:DUF6534 domain-containing protein n=1 Tax=Agrocybe pediades TaxID=84607 RepID=A0A8H4QEW5_9AGAR|nr:hypothetical protein D9613_012062 [Agrocybe pediades]
MSGNSTLPGGIPPNVGAITGPRILGVMFQWGLFGVLCTQVYIYYLSFPRDPWRHKAFVYTIFAFEIIQTVIVTISAWNVFGSGYGNFQVYNRIALAWFSVPAISGIVAFLAEVFYAHRIRVLSESYWVAGSIVVLALLQLAGSFAAAAAMKHALYFKNLLGNDFYVAAALWNGGSAACDIIIAVCMTYYLSKRGSGTMPTTQVFLRRVIRLVIETGTVTGMSTHSTYRAHRHSPKLIAALIAILNLVLELLPSRPAYYQVPSEMLAKVYSNSLMVMLNSRIVALGGDAFETPISRSREITGFSNRGTDAFELGEGVRVTREEVVFPGIVIGGHKEDTVSKGCVV